MNVTKILGLAILIICLGSDAEAFSLSMDVKAAILEPAGSISLLGEISNESLETECFAVAAETNDERIAANTDISHTCLDPGQRSSLRLDLTEHGGAEEGSYYAEVAVSGEGSSFRETIDVLIQHNAASIVSLGD